MAFLFNGTTLTGTADRDWIFGHENFGGPDHILSGGGGDDFIFGDIGGFTSNVTGNGTFGTALNIDATAAWYTSENPLVEDSAVPHTTIFQSGEGGSQEFFSVTLAAGDTITLDIDAANFDTIIELLDTDGVTQLAFDDDDNGSGEANDLETSAGDSSGFTTHSFLTFTVAAAGTYFIRVGEFDSGGGGGSDLETDDTFCP